MVQGYPRNTRLRVRTRSNLFAFVHDGRRADTIRMSLSLPPVRTRVILNAMRDWTALSEHERREIEDKLMAALNSIGIKGAATRWNMPGRIPHWQLIIETSWCAGKSWNSVSTAQGQAMARADIQGPAHGVVLRSPPER